MHLLIVDDDPYFRVALERQLRRTAIALSFAAAPAEALALLAAERFDAVLVDHRLGPGVSGLDLLASIAARYPEVRRLVTSGGAVAGWERVAHGQIDKPFTSEELLAKLATTPAGYLTT